MKNAVVWEIALDRNVGYSFIVLRGQSVCIRSMTIIDFVAFNQHDLTERFDQARTKANQQKIFITTGDSLISKLNNKMLTITEDTFNEGHHDLQEGMCSRKRYELAAKAGRLEQTYGRPMGPEEIPPHGCWENLSNALADLGIVPVNIPSPFNLFQNMAIDGNTGAMRHTAVRPKAPGGRVTMRAEMDVLAALSVCPDPIVGGQTGATVTLLTE